MRISRPERMSYNRERPKPAQPAERGWRYVSSWGKWRVGLLLAVLVVVGAWAGGIHRIRSARAHWDRPVGVAVILLTRTELDSLRVSKFHDGLADLDSRLASEFARYRSGGRPFSFSLVGPVRFTGGLSFTPESPGIVDRAKHGYRLWSTLRALHASSGFDPGPYDARIYLILEPATSAGGAVNTFAEGAGDVGGEVGFVRASAGADDALLALTAVSHELLHCLGATDKYDASGHAVAPDGLAEPELSPQYPQRYAEWMVGELPTGPGRGRLPSSLAELRIGPVTAREIGWTER